MSKERRKLDDKLFQSKKTGREIALGQSATRGSESESEALQKDLIDQYLADITVHSLLTAEEEILLGREIKAGQQAQARLEAEITELSDEEIENLKETILKSSTATETMILSNTRLVISIAKRYQRRGMDLEDLIQEGNIGLIKAAEKFDPEKEVRFSTYATWWIRQAISRAIDNKSRTIRIPAHLKERLNRLYRVKRGLRQLLEREPNSEEIIAAYNEDSKNHQIDSKTLAEYLLYESAPLSLDQPIDDEETGAEMFEFFADDESGPEELVLSSLYRETLKELINKSNIPLRDQAILEYRFGFVDGKQWKLEEIAQIFNVTRERIRQTEARALRRLRRSSMKHKIDPTGLTEKLDPDWFDL